MRILRTLAGRSVGERARRAGGEKLTPPHQLSI